MSTFKSLLTIVVVAGAMLVSGASCDREKSDDGTARDAPNRELLESKGESCSRDIHCSGYLRCLEQTCRIPPAVDGDSGSETPRVRFHTDDPDRETVRYYVELATTAAERRRGLMYRPEMHPDWGMLFVYDGEAERSFWMKNTRISLDMIFMDRTGEVVNIIRRAEPETTTARPSEKPAKFVLELNGGVAEAGGIETGDRMSVENIPSKFSPSSE